MLSSLSISFPVVTFINNGTVFKDAVLDLGQATVEHSKYS
jgi:hypothetical protein